MSRCLWKLKENKLNHITSHIADQSAVYFYPGHLATFARPVWKLSREDDVKILKLINLFWFGRVR